MSWKDLENPLFLFEQGDKFAKFHFDFASKTPPGELFHYTSDEALIPILDSQSLFATERTYLNDRQEFNWGFDYFQTLLKTDGLGQFSEDFKADIDMALAEKPTDSLRHFVASLSANPDLLNQWRAYAANGKGFAIGLNGRTIRDRAGFGEFALRDIELNRMPKSFCYCYHLLPVIYEREAQKETLLKFLDVAYACWKSLKDPDDSRTQKLFCLLVQHRVKELLISFKNPAFQEEREWRIVATVHKESEKIHYRNGRYGITPYLKLNVSPREALPAACLDITSIWIGPDSPVKENTRGLEMLLANRKLQARLMFSEIAYRG